MGSGLYSRLGKKKGEKKGLIRNGGKVEGDLGAATKLRFTA